KVSLPLLISALKREQEIDIKRRILFSLSNYYDSDDVAELLGNTARKDADPVIRETACRSIGRWTMVGERKNDAIQVLRDALGDPSLLVVDAALQGLTFPGTPEGVDLARKRIEAITDPALRYYFEFRYFTYEKVIAFGQASIARRKGAPKTPVA